MVESIARGTIPWPLPGLLLRANWERRVGCCGGHDNCVHLHTQLEFPCSSRRRRRRLGPGMNICTPLFPDGKW